MWNKVETCTDKSSKLSLSVNPLEVSMFCQATNFFFLLGNKALEGIMSFQMSFYVFNGMPRFCVA